MTIRGSYKGCPVIVHDAHGNTIVKTTIIEHDKDYMTIIIADGLTGIDRNEPLTFLILFHDVDHHDGIHEYSGNIRQTTLYPPTAEVTLFKGRIRENRACLRYRVDAPAQVEALIYDEMSFPLQNAQPATVVNISASGLLIRARPNFFVMNTVFQIKVSINSENSELVASVVRLQQLDHNTVDYGCKLL